jgi:hypothetical protein
MSADAFHDFKACSFGGVTCAQYWVDFMLWESILNTNPHLLGIIELGTWEGGFSRYLYAQAQARSIKFATYDVVVPQLSVAPPFFVQLDIYRYPERIEQVGKVMGGPVALFCDGGNKPRELRTFPPLMPEGSIIVVHDWGTETMPTDVPDFLEELYGQYCDEIGSMSRVFRMRPEND